MPSPYGGVDSGGNSGYLAALAVFGINSTPSQAAGAKTLKKQTFLGPGLFVPPSDVTVVGVEGCGGGGAGAGGFGASSTVVGFGGGGGGAALRSMQMCPVTPGISCAVAVGAGGVGGVGGAAGGNAGTNGAPGHDSIFVGTGQTVTFKGASGGRAASAVTETGLTSYGGQPVTVNSANGYVFVDSAIIVAVLASIPVYFTPRAAGGYSGGQNAGDRASPGGDNGAPGGIGGTLGAAGTGGKFGGWGGGGGGGGAYPLGSPAAGGNGGNGTNPGAGLAGAAGTSPTANSGAGGSGGGAGGLGTTAGGAGAIGTGGASGQMTVWYVSGF